MSRNSKADLTSGSVFRRHGGYALRAELGPRIPPTGKRRQYYKQGFPKKKAAEAALDQVLVAVRERTAVGLDDHTVGVLRAAHRHRNPAASCHG